jgi:hypothetical protein
MISRVIFLVAGLVLGVGATSVQAGGAPGLPDGWLMNPLDTDYLLSGEPVPGYGKHLKESTRRWGVWGSAGQGRLYSMEDLPLLWVELGIRPAGRILLPSVTVVLERLGREFVTFERRSAHLRWGTNPAVGLKLGSAGWTLAGENMETSLGGELEGRCYFGLGGLLVGVVGLHLYPWTKPGWPGESGRLEVAEFKLLYPGSGLACRVDRNFDGTPLFTFEGMVRLSTGVGLGFRGDPHTGSMGGCLVFRVGGMRLETSHLVHPALGVTNRFLLSGGDPRASSR